MNSVAPVPKHAVALELLERAVELYLRGNSYYAALHLGAAAEEVFAVYIRDMERELPVAVKPASDRLKEAFIAFRAPTTSQEKAAAEKWIHDRMFGAKNAVKHKFGKKDWVVAFDAKEEAFDAIDMAISNYFALFSHTDLPWLPCVGEFDMARQRDYRGEA